MSRPDMPSIAMVCYPSHGGSGIVATELGLALAARGCAIHFLSYAPPVRLKGFTENVQFHQVFTDNYPVFHHPPYILSLATKIVEVVRENHVDIAHVHYAIPHATAAFLAREMLHDHPLRTVTTLHGTDITLVGVQPSFRPAVQFSIEKSDGVTAVSGWLRERTLEAFAIKTPIEVIPNFVDTTRFAPRSPSGPPHPFLLPGFKTIVHASNFRPVKNIESVIKVFERIRTAVPSNLVMIGEGPELAKAHDTVRAAGLQSSVFFLGIQDAIGEILPGTDLLLLPSDHESFGLIALEAMATGIPVIATNRGGTREVIEQDKSGFLADPYDVDGMGDWAIGLLRDPVRWAAVSRAAQIRAHRFDQDRIVDEYLAYYRKVLANPH
jgi:L-malate glycosyltransferase